MINIVGFCENFSEPSGSIKDANFFLADLLWTHQYVLFIMKTVPSKYVIQIGVILILRNKPIAKIEM